MDKMSKSEYRDNFTCNELSYTKSNPPDCQCAKYVAKWPCQAVEKRSCDFGKGYPETLRSIADKYRVSVEREKSRAFEIMKKLKKPVCNAGNIRCHVPTTNIPRLRCSLCKNVVCHVDQNNECICEDQPKLTSDDPKDTQKSREKMQIPFFKQPAKCRPVDEWEKEEIECGPHGSMLLYPKKIKITKDREDNKNLQQQLLHIYRSQLQTSQKLLHIKKMQHQHSFLFPQGQEFIDDVKQQLESPPTNLKEKINQLNRELMRTNITKLEYHILRQKIMQLIQEDVEKCRVQLQPNKSKELITKRFGRKCHESERKKFAKSCFRCQELLKELNMLKSMECRHINKPTFFCKNIFKQQLLENEKQLMAQMQEQHHHDLRQIKYVGDKEQQKLQIPNVCFNQTPKEGGKYNDKEITCCPASPPNPPLLQQYVYGCPKKPQEQQQNQPCSCNAETQQKQLQPKTCSSCNPMMNVVREYSRMKQREPYHECSQHILNDDSFVNFLVTAPDIHKLRYMENNYMCRDDWYTVC
ncbi:hypothetical protein HELRODRAFT_164862 [Helobdella robusta]|uniref:Uncharacterized protein n=1 Tax=Helobdella robusta TaxID=6412 RepID=T1EVW4_HELRO|nr:hypothetical protein HELRODRAFT_164862 [Helobdella robusta]ESN92759.1 hypothetical protein HELRODRAFT_164862 [Helobdella robusta]